MIPEIKTSTIRNILNDAEKDSVYVESMIGDLYDKQPVLIREIIGFAHRLIEFVEKLGIDEDSAVRLCESVTFTYVAIIKSMYVQQEIDEFELAWNNNEENGHKRDDY